MKITIKKRAERGEVCFETIIDGIKYGSDGNGYELSRRVTGTTSEGGDGIFNSTFFTYGLYKKDFPFKFLDADTPSERALKLMGRIIEVRKWVAECKALDAAQCGEVTVEMPPTIEELQTEIAALRASIQTAPKRNEKGQFVKKD
jgi:hypothetical protein